MQESDTTVFAWPKESLIKDPGVLRAPPEPALSEAEGYPVVQGFSLVLNRSFPKSAKTQKNDPHKFPAVDFLRTVAEDSTR